MLISVRQKVCFIAKKDSNIHQYLFLPDLFGCQFALAVGPVAFARGACDLAGIRLAPVVAAFIGG